MVEVNTSYQLFGAAMSVSGIALFVVYILTPLQEVWGDYAGTDWIYSTSLYSTFNYD